MSEICRTRSRTRQQSDIYRSRSRTGHRDPVVSEICRSRSRTGHRDPEIYRSRSRTGHSDPEICRSRSRTGHSDPEICRSRSRTGHRDPAVSGFRAVSKNKHKEQLRSCETQKSFSIFKWMFHVHFWKRICHGFASKVRHLYRTAEW